MWRMRRRDGLTAHALIGLRGRAARVIWFLNDHPIGVRDFDDWEGALRWTELLRAHNWSAGWRLLTDDGFPPTFDTEC